MALNRLCGKTKGRKAQLEMIGIAIVVVLVVMGFLFIMAATIKEPSSAQAGFVRAHIAQDVLNTMSISDADCYGLDMTELLKACAEGKNVKCGGPCQIFNDSLKIIMESTLEEQRLPYRLRAYKFNPPNEPKDALGGIYMEYHGCNETSLTRGYYQIKERPGILVIPVKGGDAKVMLEICSRP